MIWETAATSTDMFLGRSTSLEEKQKGKTHRVVKKWPKKAAPRVSSRATFVPGGTILSMSEAGGPAHREGGGASMRSPKSASRGAGGVYKDGHPS